MIPVVLSGKTGCGKTNLLRELLHRGFPVLNLESLAMHRGSVFGQINISGKQPSQSSFQHSIDLILEECSHSRIIFIEHEARNIGKLRIPESIILLFQEGIRILLRSDMEKRVQYILNEYLPADKNELMAALNNLRQRLAPDHFHKLHELLIAEQFAEFCFEILAYYDKARQYHLKENYAFIIEDKGPSSNADELLQWIHQHYVASDLCTGSTLS